MYSMMLKKINLKNFKENLRLVFDKIKKRWGIERNFQVFIIFVVFAFTGISVLLAKNIIYTQLGVSPEWAWYIRLLIWIVIVLPTYYLLLIFYGTVFGQNKFFVHFIKKSFDRMRRKKEEK